MESDVIRNTVQSNRACGKSSVAPCRVENLGERALLLDENRSATVKVVEEMGWGW